MTDEQYAQLRDDLRTVASFVITLVPFIERHRPIDDLEGLKCNTQGQPYRYKWDDLLALARIAAKEAM